MSLQLTWTHHRQHFLFPRIFKRNPLRTEAGNTTHSRIFRKIPIAKYAARTKVTRAPCRVNPDNRADSIEIAERFGDMRTAEHKSRSRIENALQICSGCARPGDSMDAKLHMQLSSDDEKSSNILTPRRKSRSIHTDNSLEFIEACEELNWNHERSTPRRSVALGIGERAVRRTKEGTSSVLVQSGLQERWWAVVAISETCRSF